MPRYCRVSELESDRGCQVSRCTSSPLSFLHPLHPIHLNTLPALSPKHIPNLSPFHQVPTSASSQLVAQHAPDWPSCFLSWLFQTLPFKVARGIFLKHKSSYVHLPLRPSGGSQHRQNKNKTPEWKLDHTGSRCE